MTMNLIYETRRIGECIAAMHHINIAPDAEAEGAVLELHEAANDARKYFSVRGGTGYALMLRLDAALARFKVEDDTEPAA